MTIIGRRIKARRQDLKMSQVELTERMGYANHSTIARIEAGKIDLPQSKIKQFADVLGVTPTYLMGWDAEPEDIGEAAAIVLTDPDALRAAIDYMQLDDTDRAVVRALLSSLAAKTKKRLTLARQSE